MAKSVNRPLAGWGNSIVHPGHVHQPGKRSEVRDIVLSGEQPSYLARGLGRSYGDTALNLAQGVLLLTQFQRFLSFDPDSGVLECEAGVSFADIIAVFLPKGFFLPVTPGTKFVTVAGAIANDVHGKNHHRDGSIATYVLDFTLLTATGKVVRCSRAENASLFWATVGGIGLTGIILTVRLKLRPVETAYIDVDYRKAPNLESALDLLSQTESQYQYSVAWIDCVASGRDMGRSVLMLGNPTPRSSLKKAEPLHVGRAPFLNIPFSFPEWVLNPASIQAFNALYYRTSREGTATTHYDPFFYPLDVIRNWNRMYGRRGFIQYQIVFPPATSLSGLTAVLNGLTKARMSSFLAVLKRFGEHGDGLLSFPMSGYTLALDIPVRGDSLLTLMRHLDDIVLKNAGRIYLAKDSVMSPETFAAMYPRASEFKAVKRNIDPNNLFSSSMARRLGIVEAV